MYISPARNTDPAISTEGNATSPKGTGTAQVQQAAADGLPGRPSAPPLKPSSPAPRNPRLPGRDSAVAGQGASSSLTPGSDLGSSAEALWSQLASHLGATQMQDRPPAPVSDATQPLEALQSLCAPLNATQREEVNKQLQAAIGAAAHAGLDLDTSTRLLADKKLLSDVVARLIQDPGQSLHECLAARTFERMFLPKLRMKNDHEEEPSTHTFDSILALHAAIADNHGTLGRTLLWEGACHSMAGPRQAKRKDTLKTVMFDLKIDAPDWEFMEAAHSMLKNRGLYEGKEPEEDALAGDVQHSAAT